MSAGSKYRNVFGTAAKPEEQYLDLTAGVMTSGESTYMAANHKFFAYALARGGGRVVILKLTDYGRIPPEPKMVNTHKGTVLDMAFHPFIPNMIATGAEDCKVHVSQFPEDGLTEDVTKAVATLDGHGKKVALVSFNPCANAILASGSFDRTVRVWNIEKETQVASYTAVKDNVYSVEWNQNGSMLAISSKDKKLHLVDPRDKDAATLIAAFGGTKSSKAFWVPRHNWVGATGFNKQAKRQLKLWDLRSQEKPLYDQVVDQASSILMPFFDNDNGLLYLAGKGQGTVMVNELVSDSRKVYQTGVQFRTSDPQKGGCWVPKRGLDVWKCEVARFLKLTGKAIIPITFAVPRKTGADVFQDDIFPDCYSGKPALDGDAWEGGENKDPVLMPMDPEKREDGAGGGVAFAKKKTYSELVAENEALRAENAALKAKVAELGGVPVEEAKEDE